MKIMKQLKEILGIENIDETEVEEIVNEKRLEEARINKKNEVVNEIFKDERDKEVKNVEQKIKIDKDLISKDNEDEVGEEEIVNYQTIFIDPKSFNDCRKIAKYIKNDKMVTLNLEYLDSEIAQRMMDFLMGAMLVKGASFIEINKKVYTAVPNNVKVHYDGKKNLNDKIYSGISDE